MLKIVSDEEEKLKEEISKILIKWDMPTRQCAINEIVDVCNKFIGGAMEDAWKYRDLQD